MHPRFLMGLPRFLRIDVVVVGLLLLLCGGFDDV